MRLLLEEGLLTPPPVVGTKIHRLVRELTGKPDPYYAEKKRFNRLALERWDLFKKWIRESADPFETTVRLAIAGNSIDFALEGITEERVLQMIGEATSQNLSGDVADFRRTVEEADSILYLTDNAGEIVFDKLLVEALISPAFGKKVTVATRGAPVINDALIDDAREIGMTKLARVATNGGDGLGTIFEFVSDEFKDLFLNADLVIAKGLANLETLQTPDARLTPKRIAFLFKAKCRFIAKALGVKLNDLCVFAKK